MTDSCALSRRYIVNSMPLCSEIGEYPSPSARDHNFAGPPAGHLSASPASATLKFWFGPPHFVQSALPCNSANSKMNFTRSSRVLHGTHRESTSAVRQRMELTTLRN